jgi:type I restriction enzyme S subunit
MKEGWSEVPLGELVADSERFEAPQTGKSYRQLGVRLWGEGAYERETIDGGNTQYPLFNKCDTGDLVLNKIWARNGSVTIVQPALAGAYVSTEFPIYTLTQKVIPGWLRLITKARWFWQACDEKARGTSGKNRIKPSKFLEILIPLPALAEQQRIVAHLDAIESRLTRAQKLREEAALEVEALTTSQHLAAGKNRVVRLEQLLHLDEEQSAITPDGSYPQVGIRSFGLGLFKKPPVLGSDTTYRVFNVLRAGQFVMSQVKGWEGAVGMVGTDYDGWFASPEYRTFSCIPEECDPAYLSHIVSTSWFRKQLLSATRGVGARRERVRPEMLLGLELPFPEFNQQVKAVSMLEKQRLGRELSAQAREREDTLLPSLLDRLFNS